MGRKIDMKKIEDVTKCQVTFSKRRSSLMKKANEIAVCCDVDVAFVAFSPSGRVSKFCNQKRIEDVLNRYVNLPADKRLHHIINIQSKMEKLRQLGHIKGDTSKLQYLDKHDCPVTNLNNLINCGTFQTLLLALSLTCIDIRIENLELQIKKSALELQILETGLRDYELDPEQDPSLHQLSWCERNLNHSLQRVNARKNALLGNLSTSHKQTSFQMDQMEMEGQGGITFSSNFNQNEQEPSTRSQILMQLDPWISPYSARVRESIFQDLVGQAKYKANEINPRPSSIPNFSIPANICMFPTPYSPAITPHISIEESSVLDKTLLNFNVQDNVNAWNYNNKFSNVEGPESSQINMDDTINNGDYENSCKIKCNEMHTNIDQSHAPYQVQPHKEVCQEILFDNLAEDDECQDTLGDTRIWKSKIQTSNLWEWDDLLLDENFNL